ncbi:MAG: hypothetical protein AAFR52_05080 [Pseudomonadota bacterium]
MTAWQRILGLFVAVNLVAVPIVERLTGLALTALAEGGQRLAFVLLSVAVTAAILAVNVLIVRAAARADMPRRIEAAIALFALLQFVVTIGFGFFSLASFAYALPSLLAWLGG